MMPSFTRALSALCGYILLHGTGMAVEQATEHEDVAQWARDLAAPTFAVRDAANAKLWSAGEEAIPALEALVNSGDPETVARARNLLRLIQAGARPDSPKALLKAIQQYTQARTKTQKLRALEGLAAIQGYKQILFLIQYEQDKNLRSQLLSQSRWREIILEAVREELRANGENGALALLEKAPKVPETRRAFAYLLKQTGKLDAALKEHAAKFRDPENLPLKLLWLRTNNDIDAASELARALGDHGALATFSMLKGDSQGCVTSAIEQAKETGVHDTQLKILELMKDFQIDANPAAQEKMLRSLHESAQNEQVDSNFEDLDWAKISMLFGLRAFGEELLTSAGNDNPDAAEEVQRFYESVGDSEKICKSFGCPNPQADWDAFSKWLQQEVETESGEQFNGESTIQRVFTFYALRGERDLAFKILDPLLRAQHDKNINRWHELVAMLSPLDMGEQLYALLSENGDDHLLQICEQLFGDKDKNNDLWRTFKIVYPDLGGELRLRRFLAFTGILHSDSDALVAEITQDFDRAKEGKDPDFVTQLEFSQGYAAALRTDLVSVLKLSKSLSKKTKNEQQRLAQGYYIFAAEALFKWKDVALAIEQDGGVANKTSDEVVRYAIAQKHLGNTKKYEHLLRQAKSLTLGSAHQLNALAIALYDCGESEEARDLWLESMALYDMGSNQLYGLMFLMDTYANFPVNLENCELSHSRQAALNTYFFTQKLKDIKLKDALDHGYKNNLCLGISLLKNKQLTKAEAVLDLAHRSAIGDGVLADEFFPNIIDSPLRKKAAEWFEQSWKHLETESARFPKNHDTHNTLAWLGARSHMRLKDSRRHIAQALQLEPQQPAYLDTLAELYHAEGDSKRAVQTSQQALDIVANGRYLSRHNIYRSKTTYRQLSEQQARFRQGR